MSAPTTITSEPLRISATDGYGLGASVYGPGSGGPVVVVNGATGVRQRYYSRFAHWLAGQGATVVTYDYRGIGESRPHRLRGFEGRLRDWGHHDYAGVLQFVRREWPTRPLAIIGHSVGGQILGHAEGTRDASRIVTVSSQFGTWKLWPTPSKLAMASIWFGLMPVVTSAVGYLPGQLGIGEDLPKHVALEWASWCRSDRYFLDHGISAEGFAAIGADVLSFSFTDDEFYAPRRAVDALHSLLSGAKVDRRHVSPKELGAKAIGHFGFFRSIFRETLWRQVAAHVLSAPLSPRVAQA